MLDQHPPETCPNVDRESLLERETILLSSLSRNVLAHCGNIPGLGCKFIESNGFRSGSHAETLTTRLPLRSVRA